MVEGSQEHQTAEGEQELAQDLQDQLQISPADAEEVKTAGSALTAV